MSRHTAWRLEASVSIPVFEPATSFEHQRCYARAIGGCSTKITRKHRLSHGLLMEIGPLIRTAMFDGSGTVTRWFIYR